MHSGRLALAGRLLVALLAMLAFGGLAAAAAQAEEAPFWTRERGSLGQGETHFITGKSYKETSFTALGVTTSCPTVTLKEGVLLGSNAGEPGTNDEVIEFSGGCTQTGNGTSCTVVEPIVTKPVKSGL